MKKSLLTVAITLISGFYLVATAFATSNGIALNNAYLKSGNTYDVVVKEKAGDKLGLYVNDKNPVYTTANRKGWATFHKVRLSGKGKISFTHVYGSTKNQKPINYVRYFNLSSNKVTFSALSSTKPTVVHPSTTISAPSTSTTDTQPSCANGTYVNSSGNTVCNPEAAPSAPAGATAQCRDGTYSFSQSRSGTCSHHGGVATWL